MGQRAAGCNRAHPGIEGGKKPESGSGMDLGSQPVVKAGSNPQRGEGGPILASRKRAWEAFTKLLAATDDRFLQLLVDPPGLFR